MNNFPEKKIVDEYASDCSSFYQEGWNACHDAFMAVINAQNSHPSKCEPKSPSVEEIEGIIESLAQEDYTVMTKSGRIKYATAIKSLIEGN